VWIVRIVSLLPSATEIACALGLDSQLVGISHSCDTPAVARLPRVTRTAIPPAGPSRMIDSAVREARERGTSLYQLEPELLRALKPDLVLTQDLCDVCAVGEAEVTMALRRACLAPAVLTLGPRTLAETWDGIRAVAGAAGRTEEADCLIAGLEARVASVSARAGAISRRPRVVFLEWIDPPIVGGHWNPELVELAGGRDVLGIAGTPSRTVRWDDVVTSRPDVLCLACCGFTEERARADLPLLMSQPGVRDLPCVREGRVEVFDGVGLFSRPGPRLVDSLERLAAVLRPQLFSGSAAGSSPTRSGMT
jgi:iron complex transport system substrate-binding protein